MKNVEFMILANSNANQTSNVRIYSNWNYSGVSRISDEISSKFGGVIKLLQAWIDKKSLCKKDEYLLIYNFQPLQTVKGIDYCSLNMVIKPLSKITEIDINRGKPLQLVINTNTSIVMNESMAMLEMELNTEEELAEERAEPPIHYGNYNHYSTLDDECIRNTENGFCNELESKTKKDLEIEKNQNLLPAPCSPLTNNSLPVITSPFPTFNYTIIGQEKLTQIFSSPMEMFSERLEPFWEKYYLQSDQNKITRTEHTNASFNNNSKEHLKQHFIEAVHAIWNKIFNLPPPKMLEESLSLLEEKELEILSVMQEICIYLIWNCKDIIENLSCLHDLFLYFKIEINNKDIFNQDLKRYLDSFIDKHVNDLKIISAENNASTMDSNSLKARDEHFKTKGIDLIFELTFEKIFYDNFIKVHENPFSEFFSKFYLFKKERLNNKLSLNDASIKKHTGVDYIHPTSEEEYRILVAKALNVWYNFNIINSRNILLISINPIALLLNAFEKRIYIAKDEILKKTTSKWTASLLENYLDDIRGRINEKKLNQISEIVREDLATVPNHFIIIDESRIERYFDETVSLGKKSLINLLLKDFKDRIILIRSSIEIFTSKQEFVSAIIAFNETLMEKLLSDSVNMHVYAPKHLQCAYAHAVENFMNMVFAGDQKGSLPLPPEFPFLQQNKNPMFVQELNKSSLALSNGKKNLKRSIDEISSSPPGMLTQFNYYNKITKKPKIVRIIGESFTEIIDPKHTNLSICFKT